MKRISANVFIPKRISVRKTPISFPNPTTRYFRKDSASCPTSALSICCSIWDRKACLYYNKVLVNYHSIRTTSDNTSSCKYIKPHNKNQSLIRLRRIRHRMIKPWNFSKRLLFYIFSLFLFTHTIMKSWKIREPWAFKDTSFYLSCPYWW